VAPASHPLLSDLGWHPGGTRIFATGGTGEGQVKAAYQHWVMDGFLLARWTLVPHRHAQLGEEERPHVGLEGDALVEGGADPVPRA